MAQMTLTRVVEVGSDWQQRLWEGNRESKIDGSWSRSTGVARHCCLTPVILATQEAEIKRMTVQNQPRQNSLQDPISKKIHHKKGLVEWL
jgi:hypothetical protein